MANDSEHKNEIILAGKEAYDLMRRGKEKWNAWVEKNSTANIDFSNFNFEREHNFSGFKFPNGEIIFVNSEFYGASVNFNGAEFGNGEVDFSHARFGRENTSKTEVSFMRTRFGTGRVAFSSIKVANGEFRVSSAEFGDGDIDFSYATFYRGDVKFDGCRFGNGEKLLHDMRIITGNFSFTPSSCGVGSFNFSGSDFHNGYSDFGGAKFGKGNVSFEHCKFLDGYCDFSFAVFLDGTVNFQDTVFSGPEVLFINTTFLKADILFSNAQFKTWRVSFERSTFGNGMLDFSGATFDGKLELFRLKDATNLTALLLRHCAFGGPLIIDAVLSCIPDLRNTKTAHHVDISRLRPRLITVPIRLLNDGFHCMINSFPKQKLVTRVAVKVWPTVNVSRRIEDSSRLTRLKELAENNRHHDAAHRFFAEEMRAKRWRIMSSGESALDILYDYFSGYGQSVVRPFVSLIITTLSFACFYLVIATRSESGLEDGLSLSISNSVPFLPSARDTRIDATKALFGINVDPSFWTDLLMFTQGILSFVFLFLIGLALRNRFRL